MEQPLTAVAGNQLSPGSADGPLDAGWKMAAVRFSTPLGAVKYRIDLHDLPFLTFLTCPTFPLLYQTLYLSYWFHLYHTPPAVTVIGSSINHFSSFPSHKNFAFMPSLPPLFVHSSTRSDHAIGVTCRQTKQASPLQCHRTSVPTRPP